MDETIEAPLQGTVTQVDVRPGDLASAGQQLLVIESMKMEHVIAAPSSGTISRVTVGVGDTVYPGDAILVL